MAIPILHNRKLRLSPVKCWTDPYEKWWSDRIRLSPNAVPKMQSYGLCWTIARFDEPHWRMAAFQRSAPIVRIRSRVSSVLKACANPSISSLGSFFLGRVRYSPTKRLEILANRYSSQDHSPDSSTAAGLLLHKRTSFRFEKEVRLLRLDHDSERSAFFIPICAAGFIEQVMVSPYTDPDTANSIKESVRKLGIECKQSAILSRTPS